MRRFATMLGTGAAVCATMVAAPGAHAMQAQADTLVWEVFDITELEERRAETGSAWLQFLRVPDLFAGVYTLAAGANDTQSPHDADEVYYVIAGRGSLEVGTERTAVRPGSVIYVRKDAAHRFVDITEELQILVFFATPG